MVKIEFILIIFFVFINKYFYLGCTERGPDTKLFAVSYYRENIRAVPVSHDKLTDKDLEEELRCDYLSRVTMLDLSGCVLLRNMGNVRFPSRVRNLILRGCVSLIFLPRVLFLDRLTNLDLRDISYLTAGLSPEIVNGAANGDFVALGRLISHLKIRGCTYDYDTLDGDEDAFGVLGPDGCILM